MQVNYDDNNKDKGLTLGKIRVLISKLDKKYDDYYITAEGGCVTLGDSWYINEDLKKIMID